MALTALQIFEIVGRRLQSVGPHVENIDEELRTVLVDLSGRADFLTATGTITTGAGTKTYAVPTDYKRSVSLEVEGRDPLEKTDFENYHRRLAGTTAVNPWDNTVTYSAGDKVTYSGSTWISAQNSNLNNTPAEDAWWDEDTSGRGVPTDYIIWNDVFYFWPVPDGVYTVNHQYVKFHADSVTTIEFDDRFREALVQGVLKNLYTGPLGHFDTSSHSLALHGRLYEAEVALRIQEIHQLPKRVKYRDL